MHLGGKLEVEPKVALRNRDDLSRAYTPGVARVCLAIAENPEDARTLTIKRNTVAVVTDGSAVLGLGNIGPAAALPVMEGKAALFKQFADVDAWPVCLDTQDTEEIIKIVKATSPRSTAASTSRTSPHRAASRSRRGCARCWTSRSSTTTSTARRSSSLAALRNALRVVGKNAGRRQDRGLRGRRRRAPRSSSCSRRREPAHHRLRPAAGAVHSDEPYRRAPALDRGAHEPEPALRHPARSPRRVRTCSSACPRRTC